MVSYDSLEKILKDRNISKNILVEEVGLSSRTVAKIAKNEKLSLKTINRIAAYLKVLPELLVREVSENKILQTLREEKEMRISGGFYHELQIRMTFNSNHIEGSRLSEEQTRRIFETNTLDAGDGILVDDILETVHHFRAIDYVIDRAEEPLTEEIIKKLHYIIKHDTRDAYLPWFSVGDYKKRPNIVGGRETTKPADVPGQMQKLLQNYSSKTSVTLEDIIAFHAEFEAIHPFQDGNGRVGRLIALKECLRYNVVPFIIEETKKAFYYRGLAEWNREPGYLLDTCRDGQDSIKRLLKILEVDYE